MRSPCLLVLLAVLVASCGDDSPKKSTVRFLQSSATYSETDFYLLKIPVAIEPERNQTTSIKVTWDRTDTTAFLGGDFEFDNTVTIKSFNKELFLEVHIFDDKQLDGDDVITFELSDPTNSVATSDKPGESQFVLTIKDNEQYPGGYLQADLTWNMKDPMADVRDISMELYALTDLTIVNNSIVGNPKIIASNTETGFKTVNIPQFETGKDYYLAVYFNQGIWKNTSYASLNLNGLGLVNKNYTLKAYDITGVGNAYLLGPIVSNGTKVSVGRTTDIEGRFVKNFNPGKK